MKRLNIFGGLAMAAFSFGLAVAMWYHLPVQHTWWFGGLVVVYALAGLMTGGICIALLIRRARRHRRWKGTTIGGAP